MKLLIAICAVIVLTSTAVFANVGGVPHGNANQVISGATPPGLQNKTTPGLDNLQKTPPGWNKGKKTGWSKSRIKQPTIKTKPVIPANPLTN